MNGNVSLAERESAKNSNDTDALKTVMDAACVGLFMLDSEFTIQYANAHLGEMFACKANELLGVNYIELVHITESVEAVENLNSLLGDMSNKVSVDRLYERLDGSLFHGHGKFCAIEHGDAGDYRIVGTITDIDHIRIASDEIRIAEVAFESPVATTITDPQGFVLRVNGAFTEITGYTPGEIIGKKMSLLKSGRHDEDFYREMWSALSNKGHWTGDIVNKKKAATYTMNIWSSPLFAIEITRSLITLPTSKTLLAAFKPKSRLRIWRFTIR